MMNKWIALALVSVVAVGCNEAAASHESGADADAATHAASAAHVTPAEGAPAMVVYATPTCGCCKAWIEHMREEGYAVEVIFQDDLSPVRAHHGVPAQVTGCHMGIVDGYVVEGHVPASAVTRLLAERPSVTGIAVPGMPAGSPGMEMPNGMKQPYNVYTFNAMGPLAVFESHN